MNPRVAVALVWGLLVAAALVLIPPAFRDRLPDPMAVRWGPDGADGSSSFSTVLVVNALFWVVPWLAALAMALRSQVLARRLGRIYWCAGVAFWSVTSLGMAGSMLLANLDVTDWTRAELPGSRVAVMALVAVAAGALAGWLGRGEPDQQRPEGERPPSLRLRPGGRTVWVSRIVNRSLVAVSVGAVIALAAVVVLSLAGVMPGPAAGSALPALAITLVAALATASLSVRVTEDGLAIGFGPFGWPVRRIRLSQIVSAYPETRFPSQVGGWGFRGMPGCATIMLRGGECLIIRYRSGGQLAISIDDAARGASLINALIAERVEQ